MALTLRRWRHPTTRQIVLYIKFYFDGHRSRWPSRIVLLSHSHANCLILTRNKKKGPHGEISPITKFTREAWVWASTAWGQQHLRPIHIAVTLPPLPHALTWRPTVHISSVFFFFSKKSCFHRLDNITVVTTVVALETSVCTLAVKSSACEKRGAHCDWAHQAYDTSYCKVE